MVTKISFAHVNCYLLYCENLIHHISVWIFPIRLFFPQWSHLLIKACWISCYHPWLRSIFCPSLQLIWDVSLIWGVYGRLYGGSVCFLFFLVRKHWNPRNKGKRQNTVRMSTSVSSHHEFTATTTIGCVRMCRLEPCVKFDMHVWCSLSLACDWSAGAGVVDMDGSCEDLFTLSWKSD